MDAESMEGFRIRLVGVKNEVYEVECVLTPSILVGKTVTYDLSSSNAFRPCSTQTACTADCA